MVTPIDDDLVEGPETVSVTLNTNSAYATGSPASALITIVDNEVNLAPQSNWSVHPPAAYFLPRPISFSCSNPVISDDGRPAPGSLTSLVDASQRPGSSQANFAGPNPRMLRQFQHERRLCPAPNCRRRTTVDERRITVVVNANAALTNGLQAYWRFNETSGTTAADASGNNRNGTMSGATFVAGAGLVMQRNSTASMTL